MLSMKLNLYKRSPLLDGNIFLSSIRTLNKENKKLQHFNLKNIKGNFKAIFVRCNLHVRLQIPITHSRVRFQVELTEMFCEI